MVSSKKSEITAEKDFILGSLIDFVNADGGAIPITLQVGGLLISGLLASEEAYFKYALTHIESKIPTVQQFPQLSKLLPHSYIHIANARIKCGGSTIPSGDHGVFWRGKLDSVDGFFFGDLVP